MLDVFIIILLASALVWGYKSGAVSCILKFASKIIAVVITLILSPLVISSFRANTSGDLGIRSLLALVINSLLFIGISIIVNIVVKKMKVINKIPLIGTLNKPIGACVNVVFSLFKISIFIFVWGYATESLLNRQPFTNTVLAETIYKYNIVRVIYDLFSYL